jgi:hypothetical protein
VRCGRNEPCVAIDDTRHDAPVRGRRRDTNRLDCCCIYYGGTSRRRSHVLAIDIRDSDVLATAAHDPTGASLVQLALEGAGLRVHQIEASDSDRRVYRLMLDGDAERAVTILQSIGGRWSAASEPSATRID